jgi:hypothetical protein
MILKKEKLKDKKLLKILENERNQNLDIYQIYKNKQKDLSLGLKYDLLKPKKITLVNANQNVNNTNLINNLIKIQGKYEVKNNALILPKKLSPIRSKINNDEYS